MNEIIDKRYSTPENLSETDLQIMVKEFSFLKEMSTCIAIFKNDID